MLTICLQILSIMADNASSNDTLTTELADLIAHFRGPTSRTRCFLHIINLVAKSLIKQFDLLKAKDVSTDAESLDSDMARDMSSEDEATITENGDSGNPDAEDVDSEDGLVDERDLLTAHERTALETNIWPIRLTLVKASLSLYMIRDMKTLIHSPAAQTCLQDCPLYYTPSPCVERHY